MNKPHTPVSTYRLQLHKGFNFHDASAIAKYLYDLGVSHVYSSPYLQAQPGSMHGYDVVDHQHVNEELGGAEAHEHFSKHLGESGLGQVLDIVPNHMAISSLNRLWWDVLENGAASRYASFFDIDWQPQEERLRDKVLVPVLGDQYGRVLESGGIKVLYAAPDFFVEAAGERFPVAPTSLPAILTKAAQYADSDALSFLAASFARLPNPSFEDRRMVLARHRDKTVITQLLARLCGEQEALCNAVGRAVSELNADQDALDDFLNSQNYRLSYWKTADQQLGYRRFFDVNTLIGLRMERQHVFEETHALVLDWLGRGVLDGVRVDHADGLRDPLEYFRRLREAAPDAWIVGEKILASGEYLRTGKRTAWPIEGTSGYDFLNVALRLLVRPSGMTELTKIYGDFTGQPTSFPPIAHDKKIAVGQEALGSDVNRLASIFVDLCETHRNQRDYTRAEIRRAIREIAACFPVYRTYVVPQRNEIAAEDRRIVSRAIHCAKSARPDIDAGLFDFFEQVLTLQVTGKLETEFVLRFQQFTSPIMAKGVEDTAFYCFNRLTALCEVGGDPGSNGNSLDDFHAYQVKMQSTFPATMTALSTHDTKRADDVRARITVLSEMPQHFAEALHAWARHNEQYKRASATQALPDRNSEYFLYQTLIGAWPIDADRTKAYMQKAMREAKQQTSWVANNKEYEDALNGFIDSILADSEFIQGLEAFVAKVILPGRINSLSQTLLKNIGPGVPDHYQGSELWDLSLVDPDNRRPVDYELRSKLLAELPHLSAEQIMARMDEGLPKLHLIHQSLLLRREHPEWFGADAAYTPVYAAGPKVQHAVAFLRGGNVLALAPRHIHTLAGDWAGTTLKLPAGKWCNRLTGEHIEVAADGTRSIADLLSAFPVALLTQQESSHV
jgi:(1->4)-alpha-D-glucan 1-alpha-D-glucosylmutase